MDDEIRFYIERAGASEGPVTDDEIRDALRAGKLPSGTRVRLAGTDMWAPPHSFATFARGFGQTGRLPPPPPKTVASALTADLAAAPPALVEMFVYWVHEGTRSFGPLTGAELRRDWLEGRHRDASVAVVDLPGWYPARLIVERMLAERPAREPQRAVYYLGAAAGNVARATSTPSDLPVTTSMIRCGVCLEQVPAGLDTCPECGEMLAAAPASTGPASSSGPPSIPDEMPGDGFFKLHWRPLITMGAMAALVLTGITLRYLAPNRFQPPSTAKPTRPAAAASAPSACSAACWTGEACHEGRCVWQKPNDVGHVAASAEPIVGGAFPLPKDVSDALPLDSERFAVSLLTGIQIHNARTGGVLSLVTDAPQARRLYRVGEVIYGTAPQRVYVVDPATTRLLKTIELGAQVGDVTVGASGRRALASLPSAHAVAILATEYHAEIDRIQFGDDPVGPMGTDDTGKRALTTTGQVPPPGLRDPHPQGGAAYAFDPSRLATAQDRVRAAMVGNPVSVLMTPDGQMSYVALRAEDKIVPLEWLPSGAVRQLDRIAACREPEQIELVRRSRLALVRCNAGRSIAVFDLTKREVTHTIPFNARVADLAVSPDGEQAIVALPAEGVGFVGGFVGLVDLTSFSVRLLPLSGEPTRVRLAPDGKSALVFSDRAKAAWVIR